MTRLAVGFGGLLAVGVVVLLELDRHAARVVRIWRNERRRKARRGYLS